jgi:hypothetical protein
MRVFLTGATGYIGEAIVRELLTAGHQVLGLARSDASEEALTPLGVEAHRGELSDTDRLTAGARASDGVIHTAFIHDFSAYAAAAETDRRAVEAQRWQARWRGRVSHSSQRPEHWCLRLAASARKRTPLRPGARPAYAPRRRQRRLQPPIGEYAPVSCGCPLPSTAPATTGSYPR